MAKRLLSFFGSLSILAGVLTILGGFMTENGTALAISLYLGGGFLLAGAPLLGFARVIDLLERIEANTARSRAPPPKATPEPQSVEDRIAKQVQATFMR